MTDIAYGRTDMYGCGCTVDADGYIATECARHRDPELPEEGGEGPEPWADPGGVTDECECITDKRGECLVCDDPYNEDGPCPCHGEQS